MPELTIAQRLPQKIWILQNGKMVKTEKTPIHPLKQNFLICCEYGDWSSFRTLEDCEKQIPELQQSIEDSHGRDDGYYWIEER